MNKNPWIVILIVCFGFSNIKVGRAADVVEVSPVLVQPYNFQALNQQVLERDRQNRDEEIAIRQLIEENDKLIQSTLASQQDEGLRKVDQVMLNYRDALLSRDQGRIAANGERWWPSRYGDLIDLTVAVDDIKDVHRDLASKRNLIEEKYQILNDLKDEMEALNAKLKGQGPQSRDQVIEGFRRIAQQQQDKIQVLVARLSEMDQKIAHFDEILAQKDWEITQLRHDLSRTQNEVSSKDAIIRLLSYQQNPMAYSKTSEGVQVSPTIVQANKEWPQQKNPMAYSETSGVTSISPIIVQPVQVEDLQVRDDAIRWLKKVLAVTKSKAEYLQLTAQQPNGSLEGLEEQVRKVKDDFALRLKDFDSYQSIIVSLKDQVRQLGQQVAQKQQQVDLLKNEKTRTLPLDDRLELARQLINLQQQEAALLVEKSRLTMQEYTLFDRHFTTFEDRVKVLLTRHHIQAMDWQDRVITLKNDLSQKEQEMDALKAQLKEKIMHQKNQDQLETQIQDLRTRLQEGQNQIAKLKAQIHQNNMQIQLDIPSLKEQLAAQQDKVVSLKTELANKIAESDKLTAMVDDYQKKLESKNNAYNDQLQQVIKVKQDMQTLRKHVMDKDKDFQAKELSLSMVEERMDEKAQDIKALRQELALAQQKLQGMPNDDELDFLKNGVRKAALQAKALQSLKEQLAGVQEKLSKSQETQEDKTKEILRLKYLAKMAQQDWRKEVSTLTQRLDAAEKKFDRKTYDNKMMALETRLKASLEKIKDLQDQIKKLKGLKGVKEQPQSDDAVRAKLEQALDKIQAQGRVINVLSQKLEDAQAQQQQTAALPQNQNSGK